MIIIESILVQGFLFFFIVLLPVALWSAFYGTMKMIFPGREFKGIRKGFVLIAAFDISATLLIVDLFSPYALIYTWKRNFVELPFGGEDISEWILFSVLILSRVLIVLAPALFLFSRKGSFIRAHRVAIFTALWGAAFLLSAWFWYAKTFYIYPLGPSEIGHNPPFTPAQISPSRAVLWARWLRICLDRAVAFYLWPAYIGLGAFIFRRRRRRGEVRR